MDRVVVSNQRWLKATLVLGALGFFCAAIACFWDVIAKPAGIGANVVMVGMGLFFAVGSLFAGRLLPFLHHSLHLGIDGITVVNGDLKTFLPWDRAKFHVSPTIQIIDVMDSSGNRIYAVDFYATNALVLLNHIQDLGAEA